MNENIYSTPESELDNGELDLDQEFYVVSIGKFSLLFFATMGMYSLYWFYRNWQLFKIRNGENIWPVARAIFSIFFVHSLFNKVDDKLKEAESSFSWHPSALATTYVVLSVLGHITDSLSSAEVGSPYTDFISLLAVPFFFYIMFKAQKAINTTENDLEGKSNSALTGANYFWVLFGIVLWAAVILGSLAIFGVIEA